MFSTYADTPFEVLLLYKAIACQSDVLCVFHAASCRQLCGVSFFKVLFEWDRVGFCFFLLRCHAVFFPVCT